MRQARKDIDNCIEDFLFREKSDQSWSKIKREVVNKLNFKKEGKKLHDEILNSSLKRLGNNKWIDRHFCPTRSDGRICYSLTMSRRQEIEMKLSENGAIYSLILFTELYDASPEYPFDDETIKYFLEREHIDLSLDKLIEMGKIGNTTVYRPIQCVQVVKEEHTIIELQKQNKELKHAKEDHYYYRIIGISAQDIYEHIKEVRDRINKSGVLKEGKKTSIRDILSSYKIDEKSYPWFWVDDKINQKTIEEAILNLKKYNMIHVLGIYNGEPRYTLQDDLYELLDYCLAIKEEILLTLEKWWKYDYWPGNEAERWLEFFYSPIEVHRKVEMYEKQRQQVHDRFLKLKEGMKKETKREEKKYNEQINYLQVSEIKEMKKETKYEEKRYNDKIDYLEYKFEKIMKKYECTLLTNFIQLTTNPSMLRNFRIYIKNKPAHSAS